VRVREPARGRPQPPKASGVAQRGARSAGCATPDMGGVRGDWLSGRVVPSTRRAATRGPAWSQGVAL
jgi:hypothetical protein